MSPKQSTNPLGLRTKKRRTTNFTFMKMISLSGNKIMHTFYLFPEFSIFIKC